MRCSFHADLATLNVYTVHKCIQDRIGAYSRTVRRLHGFYPCPHTTSSSTQSFHVKDLLSRSSTPVLSFPTRSQPTHGNEAMSVTASKSSETLAVYSLPCLTAPELAKLGLLGKQMRQAKLKSWGRLGAREWRSQEIPECLPWSLTLRLNFFVTHAL